VHFVGLYSIITLQCTVQKHKIQAYIVYVVAINTVKFNFVHDRVVFSGAQP